MMRKLALFVSLTVAAGVSVRAQDVASGCQGINREVIACAGTKADSAVQAQDHIYHVVMEALNAGGVIDALNAGKNEQFHESNEPQNFGFLRGSLPKSQEQWTKYKDAQCEVVEDLIIPGSGAAMFASQCVYELARERSKFLRQVMASIESYSRLCAADKAKCALPADLQ